VNKTCEKICKKSRVNIKNNVLLKQSVSNILFDNFIKPVIKAVLLFKIRKLQDK